MKNNKKEEKCICYDDGVMCVRHEFCPIHLKPKSIYEISEEDKYFYNQKYSH